MKNTGPVLMYYTFRGERYAYYTKYHSIILVLNRYDSPKSIIPQTWERYSIVKKGLEANSVGRTCSKRLEQRAAVQRRCVRRMQRQLHSSTTRANRHTCRPIDLLQTNRRYWRPKVSHDDLRLVRTLQALARRQAWKTSLRNSNSLACWALLWFQYPTP